MRGNGARAHSGRHPRGRWRLPHERPGHDQGHPGSRVHPGHGEGAHRPCCRSPHSAGHRNRLHRRIRGSEPRRRRVPHRQEPVRRAVRVRREEPGRGAAPYRRGCVHDSYQGRAGHGRCHPGRASHAHHEQADPRARLPARRRGVRGRQAAGRAVRPRQVRARQRPSAGRQLRRRRCGHPGRRSPHDGAWCGRRVRRLRHLQVGRPGQACGRHRAGHRQLAGRRSARTSVREPR